MQPFPDFNTVPEPHTERMVQFHIHAANTQLRQLYYGFIAAMALGRALVLPKVRGRFIGERYHEGGEAVILQLHRRQGAGEGADAAKIERGHGGIVMAAMDKRMLVWGGAGGACCQASWSVYRWMCAVYCIPRSACCMHYVKLLFVP